MAETSNSTIIAAVISAIVGGGASAAVTTYMAKENKAQIEKLWQFKVNKSDMATKIELAIVKSKAECGCAL